MPNPQEAIDRALATLGGLATKAAEQAEQNKGARDLYSALTLFSESVTLTMVDYTEGEGEAAKTYKVFPESILTIIGADLSNALQTGLSAASEASQALGKATGADRTEGDQAAKTLSFACEQGWLEGDDRTKAEESIAAWQATAPKVSTAKGSRKPRDPNASPPADALPYKVRITCEKCPSEDRWTTAETTTRNSLRWAWINHHATSHNQGVKPAKGDTLWQGVTDGITAIMDGAQASQGGGCVFSRVTE